MNKETVLASLEAYSASHAEDLDFRSQMIEFVKEQEAFASRHNFAGHLTASAWITDPAGDQVLLLHHRKLEKWLQPGGHIEDDPSLLEAALREAREETGLASIQPVSDAIFDLDIHLIPARKQDPAHNHLDVRFHLHADPGEILQISSESNHLRWFRKEELANIGLGWSVLRMAEKS